MTSQLNVASLHRLTLVIDVLGSFLYLLSMGVCTKLHGQTSSRLVQELNACIVPPGESMVLSDIFSNAPVFALWVMDD